MSAHHVALSVGEKSVLRQIDYRGPLPVDRIDDYTQRLCESLKARGMVNLKHDMYCLTRQGMEFLDNDKEEPLGRAA